MNNSWVIIERGIYVIMYLKQVGWARMCVCGGMENIQGWKWSNVHWAKNYPQAETKINVLSDTISLNNSCFGSSARDTTIPQTSKLSHAVFPPSSLLYHRRVQIPIMNLQHSKPALINELWSALVAIGDSWHLICIHGQLMPQEYNEPSSQQPTSSWAG